MTEQTLPPEPVPAGLHYGRYLLWVCVLTVLLYPLPYFFIRAPYFDQWSTSPYGRDLEYGMTAGHVDADVVLYGDSAALHGIDPRRMSAALGLKVFNIPNLLPSLMVLRDLELKRYLATNKPPRLIVLYLAPWNLDFARLPLLSSYDGDEMLLRHGTRAQLWDFYKNHPAEFLQFPFQFYRVNSLSGLAYVLHPHTDPARAEAGMGHIDLAGQKLLGANCKLPADYTTGHLAMLTAHEMLLRYNTAQVPAMVYIAPIPGCEGSATVLTDNFRQIPAAPPIVMPPDDFVNDTHYAHPTSTKVAPVTDQLIEAIRPLLTTATQAR